MHDIPPRKGDTAIRHDEYWRIEALHDYDSITSHQLFEKLTADGFSFPEVPRWTTMKKVSRNIQCGRVGYEACSRWELLKFVKDRQIENCNENPSHDHLVNRLRSSDWFQTFRFLDLPPELRERIAEFYIHEFSNFTLSSPTQPPLARTCRLARRETLPLFYRLCKFRLVFDEDWSRKGRIFLRLQDSSLAWLNGIEAESFACIRNLVLQECRPYDVSFNLEVSLKSNGKCEYTASEVRYAHQHDEEDCKSGLAKLMGEIGARDGPNKLRVGDVYRMRALLEG